MNHSLLSFGLVGVLLGGLSDTALGQLIAPGTQDSAHAGLRNDSPKPCRPVNRQSILQKTQAIAQTPPAPEPIEIVPETPSPLVSELVVPAPHFEGGPHPYYVTSAEESVYVSECRCCGHHRCRCTYAPLGDSLIAAFGRQAYLGSVQMMSLYDYDFAHSVLTVRGIHQLQKCVQRFETTPGPIKIEATWDSGSGHGPPRTRRRNASGLGCSGSRWAGGYGSNGARARGDRILGNIGRVIATNPGTRPDNSAGRLGDIQRLGNFRAVIAA